MSNKAAEGKKVHYADVGGTIAVSDLSPDGLHPTAEGYAKLGDAWFEALLDRDSLISIENLTGSAYADQLMGNAGANSINGGSGDDLIDGGAGNDTLTGGAGVDRFILRSGQGSDTITDFQDGQDLLALGGGLTFEQLTLTQGSGQTLITRTDTNEVLAALMGIQVSAIGASDFTAV
ncbi:MAG: hypothetical protein HC769_00835 [Cyanobacteria bacterium CRU_2_1]|nr:hypothetical protein [Cyanobacteria bacterium CRU_2_1]